MLNKENKMQAIEKKIALLKQNSLVSSFPESLSQEDQLETRFKRPASEHSPLHNITFEFTQDVAAIERYIAIRQQAYSEDIIIRGERVRRDGALVKRDEYDESSWILIARNGSSVIGGMRFTPHTPSNPQRLPMEHNGFLIEKALPGIDRPSTLYGEQSRFALLPHFRNGVVALEMCRHMEKRARENGMQYIFCIAPGIQAVYYKALYRKMGRRADISPITPYPQGDHYGDLDFKLVVYCTEWPAVKPENLAAPRKTIFSPSLTRQRMPVTAD